MLREGVTYDFRVIAVNDYGYGSPSAPSPSIAGEESLTTLNHFPKLYNVSICLFTKSVNVVLFLEFPAQKASPFYEEWWFLVVIALVGLIFILLLVFILIIRGQSKKYTKKTDSGTTGRKSAFLHSDQQSERRNKIDIFYRARVSDLIR